MKVFDAKTRAKVIAERQWREAVVTREDVKPEERTFPVAFSKGASVPRWWGIETLLMGPENVRLSAWTDSPPFLMDHDRTDQRGVVINGRLEDGVLRGDVLLSRSQPGTDLLQDITDGIRTKVSCGYRIIDAEEIRDSAKMTEEEKRLSIEYGVPVIRVTLWEPLEGSSVAIPADRDTGVGRSLEADPPDPPDDPTRTREPIQPLQTRSNAMELSTEELAAQATQREAERKAEILAIKGKFTGRVANIDRMAEDAIELKIPADQFRGGSVFSKVSDGKPMEQEDELGLNDKERKRYSFRNALLAASASRGWDVSRDVKGNKVDFSFELECSKSVMESREESRGNFAVPLDVMTYRRPVRGEEVLGARHLAAQFGMQFRDLSVGSATAGGNLVGTNLIASSFIDLLRNKALAFRLGVMEMFGLVGNVAFPKQTAATGGGWVTEGNAPSEGNATFGQVTLAPKTYAAFTDYTRQLLLQSTPGIDLLIQNDLTRVQGIAWDLAVFHGSGSAGQPQGIVGTSGVGSVTGTSLAWAGALEFVSDVKAANADDLGSMAYATTPAVWALLSARDKASGAARFLIDDNNKMAGFPVETSAQITAAHLIFGAFSVVVVGYFGGLDILVDPYSASSTGTVRTSSFLSGDVAVRHPGAFSVATAIT